MRAENKFSSFVVDTGELQPTAKRRRSVLGNAETQSPASPRAGRCLHLSFASQPEASRAEKLRHVYDALAAPLAPDRVEKSVAVGAFY